MLTSKIEQPRDDVVRLNGFVAAKLRPPAYQEAIDGFDFLINKSKKDFIAVSAVSFQAWSGTNLTLFLNLLHKLYQRACCFNLIQEWEKSLQDLNYILVFNQNWVEALLLR